MDNILNEPVLIFLAHSQMVSNIAIKQSQHQLFICTQFVGNLIFRWIRADLWTNLVIFIDSGLDTNYLWANWN